MIGKSDYSLLKEHGPFDLIFVDADHDYESAYRHSVTALNLLAPGGVILWHDYQNKDYLHGGCGVPEALDAVTRTLARWDRAARPLSASACAPQRSRHLQGTRAAGLRLTTETFTRNPGKHLRRRSLRG